MEYLGHIIDKDGLLPVSEKVRAITDAPTPSNVSELKGLVKAVFVCNGTLKIDPIMKV